MYLKCEYRYYNSENNFNLNFYSNLLHIDLAQKWYEYLELILRKENKRKSICIGDKDIQYTINYRDTTIIYI